MKLWSSLLLAFALVSAVSTKAQAANFFSYGTGERQLLLSTFNNANNWTLYGTKVSNGELSANNGANWASAYYNLSPLNGLDLDNGDISLYWSARTDRRSPERGKFYMELNVGPGATPQELRQINWNIRPVDPRSGNFASLPYLLYLDPGFEIPHEVETQLQIPRAANQFATTRTYENFRLTLSKTGLDTVVVNPYYWTNNSWQSFLPRTGATLPLTLSITNNLMGRDFFESLSFRFRTDRSFLDAVAITQRRRPTISNRQSLRSTVAISSFQQPTQSVPEPTSGVGLLAAGAVAAGATLKRKKGTQHNCQKVL